MYYYLYGFTQLKATVIVIGLLSLVLQVNR